MKVHIPISAKIELRKQITDIAALGRTLFSVQGTGTLTAMLQVQSPITRHYYPILSKHLSFTHTICWKRCSRLNISGSLADTGFAGCAKDVAPLGVFGALVGKIAIAACGPGRLKRDRGVDSLSASRGCLNCA